MYVWFVFLVFLGFIAGLHSLAFGEREEHGKIEEERQKGFFDVI